MAEQATVSENEAIRQIIAEGGAMDYVDVVDAVKKRFCVETTAAKVEQIHGQVMRERRDSQTAPPTKMSIELTSQLPSSGAETMEVAPSGAGSGVSASPVDNDAAEALKFVKTVGGLSRARAALDRLETLMSS